MTSIIEKGRAIGNKLRMESKNRYSSLLKFIGLLLLFLFLINLSPELIRVLSVLSRRRSPVDILLSNDIGVDSSNITPTSRQVSKNGASEGTTSAKPIAKVYSNNSYWKTHQPI